MAACVLVRITGPVPARASLTELLAVPAFATFAAAPTAHSSPTNWNRNMRAAQQLVLRVAWQAVLWVELRVARWVVRQTALWPARPERLGGPHGARELCAPVSPPWFCAWVAAPRAHDAAWQSFSPRHRV